MKNLFLIFILMASLCNAQVLWHKTDSSIWYKTDSSIVDTNYHFFTMNPTYTTVSLDGCTEVHRFGGAITNCYKIVARDQKQGLSASITCDSIGKVEFTGDPAFVIRMLLEHLERTSIQLSNKQEELDNFVRVAVSFSNHVPDYFRTKEGNCKWPKYNAWLSYYGFRVVNVKNPKKHNCPTVAKKK